MNSVAFLFHPINPKKINTNSARAQILNVLKRYERKMLNDFQSTTETWDHQPRFSSTLHYAGGDVSIQVETDDAVYMYLDKGTRQRWAVMSGDWVSKTSPGVIGSGPGAGSVVRRGKRQMRTPRPGIKARNFTLLIRRKHEKSFRKDVKSVIAHLPKS